MIILYLNYDFKGFIIINKEMAEKKSIPVSR